MNCWKNLRTPLLAITFCSTLLVLGKSILYPAASSLTVTSFVFPSTVPLTGWQPLQSRPLVDQTAKYPNYLSGRHYQYIQNDLPLDIDMRYVVGTNGNVKDFIQTFASIPSSPVLRQRQEIGLYGLFTYKGKAYLSACINPYGGSTFTARQFKQNRNTYDVQMDRLLPWLLSQKNLKDERCLWAHLSIPLRHSSPKSAYHFLENAWFSWYQWWHLNFPKTYP